MLKVDGKEVEPQRMGHTVPNIPAFDDSFDIGSDNGTPVNDNDRQAPFKVTANLTRD